MNHICLLGAGSQAREIIDYCRELGVAVEFTAVEKSYINPRSKVRQIDIMAPDANQELLPALAAVGPPALKRKMLETWPGVNFVTLVSKKAWVSQNATIGEGTIIAPNASVATDSIIGKHVLINLNSSISHDTNIGDYCTISPGVNIAGTVKLGAGVFVGIGASILNNITVAPGCVIGAGAVVVEDIKEENTVVVGIPAKKIKINDDWIYEI